MGADRLPLGPTALAFASGLVTRSGLDPLYPGVRARSRGYRVVRKPAVQLDLTGLALPITWSGCVTGLVCWSIGASLVVGATGAVYNRLLDRRADVAGPRAT